MAFIYSNPIVLAAAGLGVVIAGLCAKAGRALATSARWGLSLGVFIVIVNGLVAQRGETIIIYGLWLPLLGHTDVSAEALAEGGVLALRILVVLMAFSVHAACVDPDRVLRLLRPVARRSALTATLIARLVPLPPPTTRGWARPRPCAAWRRRRWPRCDGAPAGGGLARPRGGRGRDAGAPRVRAGAPGSARGTSGALRGPVPGGRHRDRRDRTPARIAGVGASTPIRL